MPRKRAAKIIDAEKGASLPESSVRDLSNEAIEKEVILVGGPESVGGDDMEEKWTKKRKKNYSTTLVLYGEPLPETNPLYLTKVGHGCYYEKSMMMINFMSIENDTFASSVRDMLLCYPSIKQINLYACKSGLVPLPYSMHPLQERVNSKAMETCGSYKTSLAKDRCQFGFLSYAEYFALKLRNSFKEVSIEFPSDLSIVACLGDVKENKGKIGISRCKRRIKKEPYNFIDPDTSLVKIDCQQFFEVYNSTFEKSVKDKEECIQLTKSRDSFFRREDEGFVKVPKSMDESIESDTESELDTYNPFSGLES